MWRSTRICFLIHFLLLFCVATFSSRFSFAAADAIFAGFAQRGIVCHGIQRTLSYFARAPHPNAAKVAVNWLLSREGQTAWLDSNHRSGGFNDSLREDIPKEKVSEWARRVKGASFFGSTGMDRRARRDSRHHQKGFGERRQGEVRAVDEF